MTKLVRPCYNRLHGIAEFTFWLRCRPFTLEVASSKNSDLRICHQGPSDGNQLFRPVEKQYLLIITSGIILVRQANVVSEYELPWLLLTIS